MFYCDGTMVRPVPWTLLVFNAQRVVFGRYERPAGLLITLYVYIVYIIALRFEGYVVHVSRQVADTDTLVARSPT